MTERIEQIISECEEKLEILLENSKDALMEFKNADPIHVDQAQNKLDEARRKALLTEKLIKRLKKSIKTITKLDKLK